MKCVILLVVIFISTFVADSEAWWSSGGSRSSSSRSSSSRRSWFSRSSSRGSSSSRRSWFSRSSSRSSSGRGRSSFPHDIKSKSGLTSLYNSRVVKVEKYERPLKGFLGKVGIKHNGVVATTKDGGRWLIHKGKGYGKSSSTVVVNAKHMSNKWKPAGAKNARPGTTIGGLVKAGLPNRKYNLWNGKCWDATKGIWKKAGGRKRASC